MKTTKIIVIILTLSVAVVFVAPFVNLEPTALRSAQAAFALLATLGTIAVLRFAISVQHLLLQPVVRSKDEVPYFCDVLALICARLC